MNSALHIKGLLIDMDGLLLDTEKVSQRCWEGAEKETGFTMPESFYFSLIGKSMQSIRQQLMEAMDPACDVDAFLEVAGRIYTTALMDEPVPVKAGAIELLEFLESNKIPRCLATSTGRDLCRHKLESSGLLKWLPERVCGNDVENGKPAPDIYLKAAELLGERPADLLVVEDSENGLRAGMKAGCRTANIPDLGPIDLSVQVKIDRIFRDLWDLKNAFERHEIVVER